MTLARKLLRGDTELVSSYITNSVLTSSGTSYNFTGQTLGQGYTLVLVINRYTVATGDPNAVTGVTIGGVAATRLDTMSGSNQTISILPGSNFRATASWWVAPSSGGTGTIAVSTISSTRCNIATWQLNRAPIYTDWNADSDGSGSNTDNSTTSVATPKSMLFGVVVRANGTNSPTIVGFTNDAAAIGFGDNNAAYWAGRNLAPSDPQTVSITTVASNRHHAQGLALR